MATDEWEKLKEKHEQEVKLEKEAREAQYKAEQEYQQLIAEEQAAYEAKHMGLPAAAAGAVMPPVSFNQCIFWSPRKICRTPTTHLVQLGHCRASE